MPGCTCASRSRARRPRRCAPVRGATARRSRPPGRPSRPTRPRACRSAGGVRVSDVRERHRRPAGRSWRRATTSSSRRSAPTPPPPLRQPAARRRRSPPRRPGCRVAVDSTASVDPDGTVVGSRRGRSATAAPPRRTTASHTYTSAGTYLVTLTVTDDDGATAARRSRSSSATSAATAQPAAPAVVHRDADRSDGRGRLRRVRRPGRHDRGLRVDVRRRRDRLDADREPPVRGRRNLSGRPDRHRRRRRDSQHHAAGRRHGPPPPPLRRSRPTRSAAPCPAGGAPPTSVAPGR